MYKWYLIVSVDEEILILNVIDLVAQYSNETPVWLRNARCERELGSRKRYDDARRTAKLDLTYDRFQRIFFCMKANKKYWDRKSYARIYICVRIVILLSQGF
jgi:uncharacterized protein with PIN domain